MSVVDIDKLRFQDDLDHSSIFTSYQSSQITNSNAYYLTSNQLWVRAVVTAALTFGIGTGGICFANEHLGTSPLSVHIQPLSPDQAVLVSQKFNQIQKSVPQQLSEIRYYLSLNVTNLSEILGVKRPTIYSWQKGDSELRPTNTKKLHELYSIAQEWKKLSNKPIGNLLTSVFVNHETLLDALCAEPISDEKINELLSEISQRKINSQSNRPSIASMAKSQGFSPKVDGSNISSIDLDSNHIFFDDES